MLRTMLPFILLLGSLALSSQATVALPEQVAFGLPLQSATSSSAEDVYQLKWPVKRVAIVGAGPGGMIAYREFAKAGGFDVHIFERDNVPGGNWHYTEEVPADAPIPNADPSIGDYAPSLPPAGVQLPYTEEYHDSGSEHIRLHRGPKPVWESLRSNAPAPAQQIQELPWPVDTKWELTHYKLRNYMRSFASFHGINSNDNNPNVSFNTRVELVQKHYNEHGQEQGWKLLLKELAPTGADSVKATWREEFFDAVIVATGRYNAPNVPVIPGLAELGQRFPNHLVHSRQYRRPEVFENESVLIIGGATSGVEIARDLVSGSRKVYESIRPDNTTLPHFFLSMFLSRIPKNVTVLPEIKRFVLPASDGDFSRVQVELVNGTILTGIDRIILATGFRYSFPFLPAYHNSSIGLDEVATGGALQPVVTDGTHLRSLHLDLFYIEEPTIGFMNMNTGMQSFVYGEYLAVALSKVWGKKAFLPSTKEMWRMYDERVEDRGGHGRYFQFLGAARADANVRYFLAWLNSAAQKYGGRTLDSLPKDASQAITYWYIAQFGEIPLTVRLEDRKDSLIHALGLDPFALDVPAQDDAELIHDIMFNDMW